MICILPNWISWTIFFLLSMFSNASIDLLIRNLCLLRKQNGLESSSPWCFICRPTPWFMVCICVCVCVCVCVCLFRPAPAAWGSSQARGSNGSYTCWPMPQPQQCRVGMASAPYTTAHGSAGSLTHWVRPGIEPISSWMLVRFFSTKPWEELLDVDSCTLNVKKIFFI